MRPLIERMRADGHEVRVTARDFAQTIALCERFGIEHEAVGRHRGERLAAKARGLASRSAALVRWAREDARKSRSGGFDVALGHGSNDVSVAAWIVRVPSATMFDYEWAAVQHQVNCRLARAVVVPESIPVERLWRYGARAKLRRFEGLKEALARIPGFVVPERAIDAQSLIAHADLVISAGGTMNREAVALGVPVYTTFEGRLGAVDERLLAEGRLRKLIDADELDLDAHARAGEPRAPAARPRARRDPRVLVDLLLSAAA